MVSLSRDRGDKRMKSWCHISFDTILARRGERRKTGLSGFSKRLSSDPPEVVRDRRVMEQAKCTTHSRVEFTTVGHMKICGMQRNRCDVALCLRKGGVGESAPKVDVPASRPVTPQDLMATIFHVLGIPQDVQFTDNFGRPKYMIEGGRPIPELV
jgi:hypothetical protein